MLSSPDRRATVPPLVDVLLVNALGVGDAPHWSAGAAAALGRTLRDGGHRVRWICPHPGGAPPPAIDGVEVRGLVADPAPFRTVGARVASAATEVLLTRWLRERHADHVHVLGLGAPGSASTGWIADRMGSLVTAAVRAAEVLCHRQDLLHVDGSPCEVWTDPVRCADCCRRSLPNVQRALAGGLSWLGGLSPFPTPVGFVNRTELVVGGLLVAAKIRVATPEEREWLGSVGLRPRAIEIGELDGLPEVASG